MTTRLSASKRRASPIESNVLVVRRSRSVLWLTLNRPERLNALSRELLVQLLSQLESAAQDRNIRAVVISGAGRGFCAGGDLQLGLTEVTGVGPIEQQTGELRRFMRIVELIRRMPQPVVAAVKGACVGAGLSIASAADIRIAGASAIFATGFLQAGVSGDFGGTWSLAAAVGPALARELYLTGRRIDSVEALRIGLVSSVHADDELIPAATQLADELATRAPLAMEAVKANFAALPCSLSEMLEAEARRHVLSTNTRDATEAREAFLARRRPKFQGR